MPLPICGHRADWMCERCARCVTCCTCPTSPGTADGHIVSTNSKRAAIALLFAARALAEKTEKKPQ